MALTSIRIGIGVKLPSTVGADGAAVYEFPVGAAMDAGGAGTMSAALAGGGAVRGSATAAGGSMSGAGAPGGGTDIASSG